MTQLIVSVLIWNSGAPTKMRSCIACGDNAVCFEKDACWVSCGFEISIYFQRNVKKAFFPKPGRERSLNGGFSLTAESLKQMSDMLFLSSLWHDVIQDFLMLMRYQVRHKGSTTC